MFLPIRTKFFISFSLLALLAVILSFAVIYTITKDNLETRIQSELENSTHLINNLVDSIARSSIEIHLQGIAETQLNTVREIYALFESGRYTEAEAKQLASDFLLSQTVGSSGYLYCIDSHGKVEVHQDSALVGQDVSGYQFIQEQLRLKTGYLEYRWRNTSEATAREKVLYMTYFPAWDWIISVSAYKSEFYFLVDFAQISKALDKVRFGNTGYPFIFNGKGDALYHPLFQGNFFRATIPSELTAAIEMIIRQKEGILNYAWQNPNDPEPRKKIAVFTYLEEFDWYVGTSAYHDELYQPLGRIKQAFFLILLGCVLVNLVIAFWFSAIIARPLNALVNHFKNRDVAKADLISAPLPQDEIGLLGDYLNQFIAKLADYHQQLNTEIHERKLSEQALRTSEQTFDSLFNNSVQFVALLDPDGRVKNVNQTALKFRNLRPEDVVGQYFWDTPWWNHSETLIGQLKEGMAKVQAGQVARFEAYSSAVREIYLDISMKPIIDPHGDILFVIAEARDITDIRRAQKELQQAQKMESVGTLAGGIAHDFNNALAGILGTVSLLQIKRDKGITFSEEDLFKHLGSISGAAQRAKDIVNQLLTLSRKYDFEMAPINLKTVLQNVCRIADNSFDKSVRVRFDSEGDLFVFGDANSLEQVFLNLCINAAHAMTLMRDKNCPWGGDLSISTRQLCLLNRQGQGAESYWCITVRDTGVGIDGAIKEKVFEPFFTTKSKGVGSGMGLAMAYHITRQHHGYIELDSTAGKGTEVRVYLPVSHQEEVQEAFIPETISCGHGTILIIDDEELVRLNADEFLQECGYQTLLAENGAQGVALYQENKDRVDLVLLDLVMPVMTGRETYTRLKEINPQVKVLLSSGFRQDDRVDEILAGGAAGFIQKPYSLYRLSHAVKDILP